MVRRRLDTVNVDKFVKAHPNELEVVFGDKPFLYTPVAFTVRKGDAEWLTFLDTMLRLYTSRGFMKAWMERAGMHGAAVERPPLEIIK